MMKKNISNINTQKMLITFLIGATFSLGLITIVDWLNIDRPTFYSTIVVFAGLGLLVILLYLLYGYLTGSDIWSFKVNTDDSINLSSEQRFGVIKTGMRMDIGTQKRTAYLNLIIGIGITLVSGVFLVFYVFIDSNKPDKDVYLLVSRISIVFFAEIFAYFFLRLYLKGLNDIRDLQSKLIDIQFKEMAFNEAIQRKRTNIIEKLLLNFSNLKDELDLFSQDDKNINEIIDAGKLNDLADKIIAKLKK